MAVVWLGGFGVIGFRLACVGVWLIYSVGAVQRKWLVLIFDGVQPAWSSNEWKEITQVALWGGVLHSSKFIAKKTWNDNVKDHPVLSNREHANLVGGWLALWRFYKINFQSGSVRRQRISRIPYLSLVGYISHTFWVLLTTSCASSASKWPIEILTQIAQVSYKMINLWLSSHDPSFYGNLRVTQVRGWW